MELGAFTHLQPLEPKLPTIPSYQGPSIWLHCPTKILRADNLRLSEESPHIDPHVSVTLKN